MLSSLFHTLVSEPLYNGLIFLLSILPYADVGFAIILLTFAVKIILLPLSVKMTKSQYLMQKTLVTLKPELERIKEAYKNDRAKQAQETMEVYRRHNTSPFTVFTSFFLLLIQLPILFALFWLFSRGALPTIDVNLLYPFITPPPTVHMEFLGLIDVAGKSIILAFLAGATQFIQSKIALPPLQKRKEGATLKDDMTRSIQLQAVYVIPIIIVVTAYATSAAVALYFLASNIFAIGQELLIHRRIKRAHALSENPTV